MAEYENKKGEVVHMLKVGFAMQTFQLFNKITGSTRWVNFETLFKKYKLVHRGVRAKVGTHAATIITLQQAEAPEVGDYVYFTEMLNGEVEGGYVESLISQGPTDDPIFVIVRM